MNIRSSFSYLVLLAVLLSVTTMARAEKEVFRWVDENGVVYFSDRPLDRKSVV